MRNMHRNMLCRDEEDSSEGGEEESDGEEEAEQGPGGKQRGDRFFQMGDMDRFAEEAEQAAMRSDNDEDEDDTGEH